MSKGATFLHILEGIGRVADPRIGMVIDGVEAARAAKTGTEKAADIEAAITQSLAVAGDYSGQAALSDPALAALTRKYIDDGLALHAYIEAHKAQPPAAVPPLGAAGSSVE